MDTEQENVFWDTIDIFDKQGLLPLPTQREDRINSRRTLEQLENCCHT